MYRIAALISMLLMAAGFVGCAALRTRNADFTKFQTAQCLRLDDTGRGTDRSVKRSVNITAPETIAEVNGLLRSMAANWKPVPSTPPYPQFTLSAVGADKMTDWMWLDVPTGNDRTAYVQMSFTDGGMHFTRLSEANFNKLLRLFGVPEWRESPAPQHDDGR